MKKIRLGKRLVWVVYWWITPFLFDEQTKWKKFDTREEARSFIRKIKKLKNFVKADEIRQYRFIQRETI